MTLAFELGRTLEEIMDMTEFETQLWFAFFKQRNEAKK